MYQNSGHYRSSCPLFKAQLSSIGLSVPHSKNTLRLRYEPNRLTLYIFLIPFYLQAVQIHSANGVKLLEA
jgi:hypothetical protein